METEENIYQELEPGLTRAGLNEKEKEEAIQSYIEKLRAIGAKNDE